jgi:transposase
VGAAVRRAGRRGAGALTGQEDAPPAAVLINSPYDVEARYSKKRSTVWTGYKVQVTETCDADTPNLIVHVATTTATVQDVEMLPQIHTALAKKDLLPAEHLVDAGYVAGDVLVGSKATHQVAVVGPAPRDPHWQARAGEGYDAASFTLDWEQETATCPQGTPSASWSATRNDHGNPIINIRFPTAACRDCSVRAKCTASATGPRFLTVRPKAQYLATQQARQDQKTREFQERYAARAGIEATISQGLRVAGTHEVGAAPRPLPRPHEDAPPARHHRRRPQYLPAQRLVCRAPPRLRPHHAVCQPCHGVILIRAHNGGSPAVTNFCLVRR